MRAVEHKTPPEFKCELDDAKNELAININNMKQEASTSVEPMPKIYDKHITPLKTKKLKTRIPEFQNVKCCLYQCRKNAMEVDKTVFKCLCEVEVPLQFRTMLVADYINEKTKILIFCNVETLCLLPNIKEYFVDSTFKSTPRPFYQLLSIHGDIGSTSETCHVVPIFYALMSDKKESSYHAIFDILNTKYVEWKPLKIHMDFEIATSNAIKNIFPDIIVSKCYYHYNKCIWKKCDSLHIKSKLYRRIVGLCAVLPLLPIDNIPEGWNYIEQRCKNKNDKKLKLFIQYMKKTWLKNESYIKEWCVTHERHRTNNVMENWHSVVNKAVNKNYVTIAKLLKELKDNGSINKNWVSQTTRTKLELEKDEELLDLKMQLVHKHITVGHFLETLR